MKFALYGLLIVAIFTSGVLFLEFISRKTKIPPAFIRKAGHVGLALTIASLSAWMGKDIFIAIGLLFTLVALMLHFSNLKSLNGFTRTSYGEVLFPLGVTLSAWISANDMEFITCMLTLGFADTAAYVFGRSIKSPHLLGSKTVAGTLAFFIISAAIIAAFTGSWLSIPIALLLALVEQVSPWGSDNLTVPLVASLLLAIFI